MTADPQAQERPPPPQPRIPGYLLDAPQQRLFVTSLLALLTAYKLADALLPQSHTPPLLADELPLNWLLWKWIAVDLVFVTAVAWLRVPRLDWGWKARWMLRAVLVAMDYALFGRWTFTASVFMPAVLKGFLTRSLSTDEHSVRLAAVVGDDKSHLGGQYTVHILAVSTAMLNPLSTIYCRHLSRSSKSDPTLVPLVLNNTVPSKVTYTLTSFDDPPTSHQYTIPASSLVRHSHPSQRHRGGEPTILSKEDDELALAAEWSLVPSSQRSTSQALRHRLPSDSSPPRPSSSDPFGLSSTETLYYIPISSTGSLRLDSVLDKDGHTVKIRRKRATSPPPSSGAAAPDAGTVALAFEETRIVRCPSAGFSLAPTALGYQGQEEEHRCLVPNQGVAESWPLGLVVSGSEPLSVKWHSREGDAEKGFRREEALEGIVHAESGNEIVPVPVNVSLSRPGRTTFYLDSVKDGYGNEISYVDVGKSRHLLIDETIPSRSVVVHRPPEIVFIGDCAKGEDVHLLKGGKKRLQMRLSGIDEELAETRSAGAEGPRFKVQVKFTPEEAGKKGWTRMITTGGARAEIEVDSAGTYEILSVKSKYCDGAVLVPNACTVVVQPTPTLSTSFSPLHDVCNSETGVLANLHLTGAPPFTVHYTVTRLSGPGSPRSTRHTRRVLHSRDELRLEPGPGEWEYRFVKVDDAFYKDLALPPQASYAKRQKIPVVGDAKWTNVDKGKTVHSCEGETVQVEVELVGQAPWDIEYSVVGQPSQAITGITESPHVIDIDIPKGIAQQGGQFALSLETVREGNGCRRPLTVSDLVVEVRRTKPTARFHGAEGSRSVLIRDYDTAKIPLRLTGEGPWTITYQPSSICGRTVDPVSFVAHQANAEINIRSAVPGTYRLLSVRDKYCPGDVSEPEWTVQTLPRPKLRLGESVGKVVRNGSVVRRGVCANAGDAVPILFEGTAPFKAFYSLQKGSHHSESRQHSLQAIQSRADLTLYTATPGHHTYTFTGVGDALYTEPNAAGLEAPDGGKAGVVRLEQDVFDLPSASFAHGAKQGFCVNDELASRGPDDLIVNLVGQAPFELELEVREDGHRNSKRYTVPSIQSNSWPVSLPYGLHKAQPHNVLLRRVKDANGCETLIDARVSAQSGKRTIVSVPVAEIATITPVSAQEDHCVGDFLDFVVQGSPPFTVKYEFDGKQHSVPLTSGKFQRIAASPGIFKIVSVGHGEDQCRSNQVDIVKRIHPIPSARVNTGDSYVVDIREGEQTEIVFSFTGTPPFSFTYSRRAAQDRSKDRTVLETHTVTGIEDYQYSIYTSQEGTWSVSFIQDKYCAYPPSRGSAVVKA
ncbi:nucleoporin Pom152 [Rhodotorula toruloides]|uniref:Nucleoporin Pom152 n=1 Tax=Rhodotorula toruloides TaxID=5286 RepID=A0A511KBG3_RHOTO|nr:nucleoporin Pom152 [Rhodotorula toruloides]